MKRRTTKKLKRRDLFHGGSKTRGGGRQSNIVPDKDAKMIMILPCADVVTDCESEDVVISINNNFVNRVKTLKPDKQGNVMIMIRKKDLHIGEPEQFPSQDNIKNYANSHEYIEDDPTKFNTEDKVEYYMIKPSKPYLLKLGQCVKKNKDIIRFAKEVNNNSGEHIYDMILQIPISDIENHDVMITDESGIKLFAYMNSINKLSAMSFNSIRDKLTTRAELQKKANIALAQKGTKLLKDRINVFNNKLNNSKSQTDVTSDESGSNSSSVNLSHNNVKYKSKASPTRKNKTKTPK